MEIFLSQTNKGKIMSKKLIEKYLTDSVEAGLGFATIGNAMGRRRAPYST